MNPRAARRAVVAALVLTAVMGRSRPAVSQVIQGSVLDEDSGAPVPGVLVSLYDDAGGQRALAVSDSAGFYRIVAPAPGDYQVVVEGLGLALFRSHLLAVTPRGEAYEMDLLVRRVPIPIRGIEVSVERREAMERSVRLLIGMSPRSLRMRPIPRPEIESHLAKGHNLTDLLRWSNIPSFVVRPTEAGPCYQLRGTCVPVYLNGARMGREWSEMLPLELAEMVVILLPKESIQFPSGAVLLYTAGWIG